MRCTCVLPLAVCQFLMSSFTAKSFTLSAGMTCPLVGAVMRAVGSGAAGSGDAAPAVSVTGGAGGGAGGPASGGALATGAVLTAGGGGGGGGGGGKLSFPPPHAKREAPTTRLASSERETIERRFMA